MKKRIHFIVISIFLLILLSTSMSGLSQSHVPGESEIASFLNQHPLLVENNAFVLEVYFLGEALVIDLSEEVLPEGIYDQAIFNQLSADLDETFDLNMHFMTTFKIEGQTLDNWGQPMPNFEDYLPAPTILESTRSGPLTGVRIALSPGHGLYWNETYAAWFWQRLEFWGIREDTINSQIMRYVQMALLNQGATVIQLREMDPYAGYGVSGYPKWYEGSRQYAISLGLPSSIYDGSNTNYNSDIRSRPYMANYYDADIFISLHNNGWDGALTGTETYFDYNNHAGSPVLAAYVHNKIINTIRAHYDPDWWSRGIKISYDDYGEINYAEMPAILIELAFMDNQYLDNVYLHDENFKILAAEAIAAGICEFRGTSCPDASIFPSDLDHLFYLPLIMQ